MNKDQQAALDRWAEVASEYAAIEEFIGWAGSEKRAEFRALHPYSTLANLLDEYYGINRQELEAARRALLQEARAKQEGGEG